ncbi:LysM peptidoglycan-binding domain-containing protein [Limosilactobacillus secaliphilus]|uniref:Peptidoglycan hydrolase n=1 Tax=Limosilactobacillus secaliphilus TaxID=396268 RepID=A0A0R2I9E4_9LACO|nr:LysM peptidoglycan-binding domain-containing protein [Limosilactobacillus secaliphilus]KRN58532.1 N-acetylmuramoyl-L-alanine amidase [Limosilactobacillus secaliphilus]
MLNNPSNSTMHYKMYKSGRKWMFASLCALTLFTAGMTTAHADAANQQGNRQKLGTENNSSDSSQPTVLKPTESNSNNASASAANSAQATVATVAFTSDSQSTTSAASDSNSSANSASQASAASAANTSAASATNTSKVTTLVGKHAVVSFAATTASTQVNLNNLHFSNDAHSQQFIESVAQGAINGWKEYRVLPSVTVAQAILESGWGRSTLSTQAHNLFGIKGSYNGQYVNMPTSEWYGGRYVTINDNFRAYPNNSASVEDHGRFLYVNSRYHNLLGDTNYASVTAKLHADGYATAPNYASSLNSLIQMYNLTQLDHIALSGSTAILPDQNNGSNGTVNSNSSNYYTVQSGDTLSGIASAYNTSVATLANINGLNDPNRIYVGQRLLVRTENSQPAPAPTPAPAPAPSNTTNNNANGTYTVQSGDTLSSIASRFGISWETLAQINHLSNPNLIFAGQVLKLSNTSNTSQPSSSTHSNPTPTAPAGVNTYTVQSGDTLSGIAGRFGTSYESLASINHISNPNRIYVGQVLQLNSQGRVNYNSSSQVSHTNTGSYTVKSGDTLSGIASQYGTSYEALAQLNGISNPNEIYVGQVLRLGGSSNSYTSYSNRSNGQSYTVQSGDTLSGIAARYGLDWTSLAAKNGLQSPYTIYVGQHISL